MKIRPDQIEGIQPEQTQRRTATQSTPGQAFGEFLNQEVARGESPTAAAAVMPPLMANPLLATGALDQVQSVDKTGAAVAGQVESILDKWDSYAATLQTSGASLKAAYGTLDEIASGVEAIRTDEPDLASTHPGLKSIVDELDAMAATERFKFNRGDYI
ncbi:MAG: hypothetical protein KUA35_06860 [Pseudodesulfovibrio sp.]|uniref:Uncharacterized protein n=1 Tax=Pseudodesulfovibrio aespoeensis (strain ATCC 700646 / DSM 10631 / Aspo-2) TaxID=643562 RepID=E6VZE1_PSEA9|nr:MULTISPECIES: hypothetical protein [Pseudodesulfovibrio]MBU4190898.1 hypothetical protein [Pseudomonadota bacterium]ADU64013.1 hypothetical protein Daes_3020 [Pseudodesulfovibrio aespoeensis Aspo-2]MBU4244426.1 hypothetical protein [Pseudomonadota bacterium]MBU4380042.1 hypothetical protein [Pseudomonadota bacterium]MBU4475375.1 hypothetical protein [Pseudomonadota bacterium]